MQLIRVLSWELLSRSWPYLFLSIVGMVLLPWFMFNILLGAPANEFDSRVYHPPYLGVLAFMLCAIVFQAQEGLRLRLFVRPVSTRFITAWLCIIPAIVAVTAHFVVNGLIWWVFGAKWPWLRPALFFGLCIVMSRAFYFRLLTGRLWEIVLFGGLTVALIYGFIRVYSPEGTFESMDLHRPFSAVELCIALLMAAGSLLASYHSLSQCRVGVGGTLADANEIVHCLSNIFRRRARPMFASGTARDAIVGYLWREGAIMSIACAGLFGLLTIFVQLITSINHERSTGLAIILPLILSGGVGGILGVRLASCVRQPGDTKNQAMSVFHSARPIRDEEIWGAIRRCLFRGSIFSWLLLVALSWVIPLCAWFSGHHEAFSGGNVLPFMRQFPIAATIGWLVVAFFVAWTVSATTAAVILFGRDEMLAMTICGVVFFGLFSVLGSMALRRWMSTEAVDGYAMILWLVAGAVVALVVVYTYLWALRQQHINTLHAVFAASIWLLIQFAFYAHGSWTVWYLTTGTLMWAATTLGIAAGPLGLTASRHR